MNIVNQLNVHFMVFKDQQYCTDDHPIELAVLNFRKRTLIQLQTIKFIHMRAKLDAVHFIYYILFSPYMTE
jgi:hypothetical protein